MKPREDMTDLELWRAGASYDEIRRLRSFCELCGERIWPAEIRWDEGRPYHVTCPDPS